MNVQGLNQLTLANGERYTFASITEQKRAVHEELFQRGTLPDMNVISGWQYQGWNLSLMALMMGIRRFTKGLQTNTTGSGDNAELNGYNLWIKQQGGPNDTWVPSAPHRHGFYKVSRSALSRTEFKHPHALLLDYGRGGNPWYQPAKVLRDYIVQVYPNDPTLLIGKAYVALGGLRIFGGNFVMRRSKDKSDDRPLT